MAEQVIPGNSPKAESGSRPWHAWLRWLLALLVAVLAAVYFLNATEHQTVCQHSTSGALQTTQSCEPPRLLDLAPFGLIIVVLLWPDLGEMSLAGLITLKRRISRQEARQEGLEETVVSVQHQLSQLSISAQNQSQAAAANVYLYPPDQDEVRRGIVGKEAAISPQDEGDQDRPQEKDRPELLGEFLQEYARLEPYIFVSGMRRYSRAIDDLNSDQIALVEQWNDLFSGEIGALRQTRNVVVHEPERVGNETLKGAVENTKELGRILFDRLERPKE